MKPVLLLIPGMFNTGAIWEPVAQRLRGEADIRIAEVLTQDSMQAMATDAWSLVANVPAGVPRVVCGYSMGGYVAIELLAAHHAEVQGAAFIDTSAKTETPESLVTRDKTIGALERAFDRTVEGIIPYSLHPSNHTGPLPAAMRSMMHAVGAAAAIRQTHAIKARTDHRAMLSRLAMPALVACGREDKVTPPPLSEDLAHLIPGAELAWIEEAGHQTPIEQPDELAQLLRGLLARVATR